MPNGRHGRGGRGGPGGGGGGVNLELFIEGKRDDIKVSVRLFQGNTPKTGERVRFFVGAEANPYKEMVDVGPNPWEITIGQYGMGIDTIDLSTFAPADYTTLTAVWGNRTTTKALPVDISPPGKAAKVKRLRVTPEDAKVESMNNRYKLDIMTFDPKGKDLAPVLVQFRSDDIVTIINRDNGTVIATDVRFCELNTAPRGILAIEVSIRGLRREVSLTHGESAERVEKTLSFR